MQRAGVVRAVHQRRPAVAAILRPEDQVEGTYRITALRVLEPHVEKRFVRALGHQRFGLQLHALGRFVGRVRRVAEMGQCQLGRPATIELLFPGAPTIGGMQNHALMPHRPTLRRVHEVDCREIGADGNARLSPGLAILREQHVTTLTHSHQTLARLGQRIDGSTNGERAGLCWQGQRRLECRLGIRRTGNDERGESP